jgi:hypothetical protein
VWLNQTQVRLGAEAEADKAQAALDAEASNIRDLRKRGEWVGIWIVVNEPRTTDLGNSIFTTLDQTRSFAAVLLSQGRTEKDAHVPPAYLLEGIGETRVNRRYLYRTLKPLAAPPQPSTAKPILTPGPHTPEELDRAIDQALFHKDWKTVALILNGFSLDDIEKRVNSDSRLRGNHLDLMVGALDGMIRWPPPNRVADAIYKVDQPSHRLGLINFVRSRSSYSPLEAALGLNGLDDTDLDNEIPRNTDHQKAIHDAAVQAGLTRVSGAIEKRHAFVTAADIETWKKQ